MKEYLIIGFLSILMVGALIYTYNEIGSPLDARAQKIDRQRENDFATIKYSVEDYYRSKYTLPKSLADLSSIPSYTTRNIKDPETGKEYEYKETSETTYKLCADFGYDTKNKKRANTAPMYGDLNINPEQDFYTHQKGHQCFDLSIPTYLMPSPPPQILNLPENYCQTQGTKMWNVGGKGEIGCDILTDENIDLSKSYCQGQKTLKKEYLKKDELGRQGWYYATLKDLNPQEEVRVFVVKTNGDKLECLPSLNRSF